MKKSLISLAILSAFSVSAYAASQAEVFQDGNLNMAIIPVAGVYVERKTSAAYITTAVGGSGPTAESIAAAVLAALNATTIPVDARKMNGAAILGDGTAEDLWRGGT